jgi:NADP-dependent 3-hydroxy acid dehydrogenase YdfG
VSVLITGASRGIGRATALELSRGHHVIATARHIEALSDLTTGARLRLDVTNQPFVDAAIAAMTRGNRRLAFFIQAPASATHNREPSRSP